jgi:hypothetical protein
VGTIFAGMRVPVLLESGELAANHAGGERDLADRAQPLARGNAADRHSQPESAGVGSTIATSFRVFPFLPFRAQWIARTTEFEWNSYFADVQDRGRSSVDTTGTGLSGKARMAWSGPLVRDGVDYDGFAILGSIADALFVRRQRERTIAEQQKTLPALLA